MRDPTAHPHARLGALFVLLAAMLTFGVPVTASAQSIMEWAREFPKTDFSQSTISFREIVFDGARRDSIPPIYDPVYEPVAEIDMGDLEPVISVVIEGEGRAYPLRMMLWHEIVNDRIGDTPFAVTYCPLCNSGLVFDRRLEGRELVLGNTGRIRHFDMVMFDHQTETWWQQFGGEGIIGELAGKRMKLLPARLESLAAFRERAPGGQVLVPDDPGLRPYGETPYAGMERRTPSGARFPYDLPEGVGMFDYVVVVGDRAWPLQRIASAGHLEEAGLVFRRAATRNSLHDSPTIAEGRELTSITVTSAVSATEEVPHDITFAFAFSAFVPDGDWMLGDEDG